MAVENSFESGWISLVSQSFSACLPACLPACRSCPSVLLSVLPACLSGGATRPSPCGKGHATRCLCDLSVWARPRHALAAWPDSRLACPMSVCLTVRMPVVLSICPASPLSGDTPQALGRDVHTRHGRAGRAGRRGQEGARAMERGRRRPHPSESLPFDPCVWHQPAEVCTVPGTATVSFRRAGEREWWGVGK